MMSDAAADELLKLALASVESHTLALLDTQGVIMAWLAGGERLFGYKAAEIVGQNFSILFTPEDVSLGIPTWEQATAQDSREAEDDRWMVRKDGGRIWVSGTTTALRDEQGKLLGFVKLMRNRTDQKLQVETFESRIQTLKQIDERKSQFISILAHELRNPLNAIAASFPLLECEPPTPDTTLALGIVRRQVEFMERMLHDLLEVTRTATGKIVLHRQTVVLQEVILQAIEVCRPRIQGKSHHLHPLIPEGPVVVFGDAIRLRQVFVNLLENAAKCTHPGGAIWVKVNTDGNEAIVRVQDTGIGITPEVMPHIFDLFAQGGTAPSGESGLGIGLSVVKNIVAMHGGTVQATSDGLGKGSEFTVRLPLLEPRHPALAPDDGVS